MPTAKLELYGYVDPFERDVLEPHELSVPLSTLLGRLERALSGIGEEDSYGLCNPSRLCNVVELWLDHNPGNRTGHFVAGRPAAVVLAAGLLTEYPNGVPLESILYSLSHDRREFRSEHRGRRLAAYVQRWYWQSQHPLWETS